MLNRREAWAPVGLDISGCSTIEDALKTSELDFDVVKNPVYNSIGEQIPNWFATTRTDDNTVLGMVGNRYKIVQNKDAFDFTDNLIPEGMKFEKAGIWKCGAAMWVEAKLPDTYKILGDDVEAHLVFINSHDGKGSVRVAIIPNRLACSNQLNFALKGAQRSWSAVHSTQIGSKLKTAQETLGLARSYMTMLNSDIDYLANKQISDAQFDDIINRIFPVDPFMSARKINNIDTIKAGLHSCLLEADVANFNGSAWEKMCAVTDYFDHCDPQRNTVGFNDNRWEQIANGHPIIDRFFSELMAA